MDDKKIVELFFERSEQALTEVQSKYGALCLHIADGILSNHEDAEETVNSSYMKLWNAIPPKRPENLCGYLCMIVRNTALNTYDRIRRRPQTELSEELCELIPDSLTVEGLYDSRSVAVYINEYLGKSGAKGRDIFVARYYYNMPIKSIAKCMRISESSVKTRLSRMRAELKTYLSKNGIDV